MTDFKKEFLAKYLQLGLGAMPKSDVDALVMHLLDRYGLNGSKPLATLSNQAVSERLKTPVTKIKRLRYDAALKFGADIESEAKGRFLATIANAALDAGGDTVHLIVEDNLAKNWLQGQLKKNQQIFDHSFNTELVKVSADGLFEVLDEFFDKAAIKTFRSDYESVKKRKASDARKAAFRKVATKFAEGAAKASGAGVVAVVKAQLGLP